MRDSGADRAKPNAPWYIKVFVLLHIFCITSWALPNAKDEQIRGENVPPATAVGDWVRIWNNRLIKPFPPMQVYMSVTGFWQYWDMFAPNPSQTDWYCTAEIFYKDGTKKDWVYPRIYDLPLQNKYVQERYRKFFERVNDNRFSYLWPQFCLRIAHLNDNLKNPPVTVRITRHWLPIAPPGQPQQQRYDSELIYEYQVDAHALDRMRKELL